MGLVHWFPRFPEATSLKAFRGDRYSPIKYPTLHLLGAISPLKKTTLFLHLFLLLL